MKLPEQLAALSQRCFDAFKSAMFFLQTHPSQRYLILIILLTLMIILILIPKKKSDTQTTDKVDINAIAGEDVVATQLDLAQAYIEMDQRKLAKKILKQVKKRGSRNQQLVAQRLMASL